AFLLGTMIWDGAFTLSEGLLCLICFIVYILYALKSQRKDKEIKKEMKGKMQKKKLKTRTWVTLALGAFFIYLGATYTIESIIQLSSILNIGAEIIAVSAVALGTSLPELVVSVNAAKKGKHEVAVGNVVGSNIFNAMAVMGIPALVGTLVIPESMITFGLPMMIIGTLLFFFTVQDKEVTRWEGWMLVLFYVYFIGKLFNLF
ncbi:MAG: hypothetical protein MI867_15350, partial [Pseudomonadales bacterium]|nr:hypothetical protein [Pseudomonadales bacterium]